MKELLFKSLICVIAVIFLANVFVAISYAENDNFDLSKYGNDAKPSEGTNSAEIEKVTRTLAGSVIGAVRIAGTGIALIMITVIAIKYITAAPGDRADIKKSSIQYVVGAVIVFGSAQILGLIVDLAPGLFNGNVGSDN